MSKYKTYISNDSVYKFDTNGNPVNCFDSVKAAATEANSSPRLIFNAIAGKTKSKGFYYSYDEDFKIDSSIYNKIESVYLYELNGQFFKEFSSPKDCVSYFNDKNTSRLYSAIRTGGLYKGYQVSKEKLPYMKAIEKKNTPKRVAQYDSDGRLIKI